jgi:CRP-like cAMP-binding protein
MSELDLRNSLASHPFVLGLSDRQLDSLAALGQIVSYPASALVGREGEPADAFYLIQSGRVALEIHTPDRGGVRIQTVGAGDPVGWSWLVPPHRWLFDARVVEAVQAIAFDAAPLRDRCERDHELGYQLLKRLVTVVASRLVATRLQLLDVYR